MTRVAVVHDYLTQRGGAERVVLDLLEAFPGAPLYTAVYEPDRTFPEFAAHDVHVSGLNAIGWLRHDHRLGLPLYPAVFARLRVRADVVVCSSSGFAHGAAATGRKVVYCHNPPRWLYQATEYLGERARPQAAAALALLAPPLRAWDRRAARSADRYLVNSSVVRDRVRSAYGIDADLVPPPPGVTADGPVEPVQGVEPGFLLCVSRLLPYKNVVAVAQAASLARRSLVVVGDGPDEPAVRDALPPGSRLLTGVSDARLRWLYANCESLVAAAHEDFGLTPLEAAGLGRPSVTLRGGGFLDTVDEGRTGVFFDEPRPDAIARSIVEAAATQWSAPALRAHAAQFSRARFVERVRAAVADVVGDGADVVGDGRGGQRRESS
jgi:glycosyltransferase involved in cell wall biosynthesis